MYRRPHSIRTTAAFLSLLALGTLAARPARADDASGTVTVNPIDLVNGYVNFEIDTAIASALSFHAGLNFLVWDGVWEEHSGDAFAIAPELGLRLYPFLSAPAGLWIGPFVGVAYVSVDNGNDSASTAGVYAGGEIGFTLILFDFLAGSVGAGLGYQDLSAVVDGARIGPHGVL
ncbi:MAG: hypothetical protein KC417_09320, partial [Myxococcales bacterium]|nr:hypothetical protein [Myxococcales bacterium]